MSFCAGRIPALAIFGACFVATALVPACGQQVPAQAPVPPAGSIPSMGLESPYEARTIVNTSVTEIDALKPVLASVHPDVWYQQKGAPSTYVVQWQTAQNEVQYVDIVARQFLQKIDSLPVALNLYYRMEALEATVRSVDEGALRYGDPAAASKLVVFVAKSFDRRQRLRDYIRDLATNLEQNYKIADDEAQRCRAMISREPSSSKSPASSRVTKPK